VSAAESLNEPELGAAPSPASGAAPEARTPPPTPWATAPAAVAPRWLVGGLAAALALAIAAGALAWRSQQRLQGLEQELVRRQQDSQGQSAEARTLARQAQELTRDSAAKLALLEARVAEVSIQRGQLEELMQSLTRSRDENIVVDIDSGIRVAMQQAAITGSAEPLVAALKQADERLVRHNQPRLEGVRRAIARDLDRAKAVGTADLPSLSIKLDEAVRMVDELPLLASAEPARDAARANAASGRTPGTAAAATTAAPGASAVPSTMAGNWLKSIDETSAAVSQRVWGELRSLVRVTRIDRPDAALLAPENAFFLRENLKLRLLNARLALLSRQYDTAQSDLLGALNLLERYFDRASRRTMLTAELLRQVAAQARQVNVQRPDDTLAALASLNPGVVGR